MTMSHRLRAQTQGNTIGEVLREVKAQDDKWGEQHLPDGTSVAYAPMADNAKAMCDTAHATMSLSWKYVLTEEFFEAMAEEDEDALVAELIQVAAVAVNWIADIRSRSKT